jgi:hypothetical protein
MQIDNILTDINKFPSKWGILFLPISMSRIDNSQIPSYYGKILLELKDKVQAPKVGIHFQYTEGMYMNFEEKAFETKNAFVQKMMNHSNGLRKFIKKHPLDFQIEEAFTYNSWFQLSLNCDIFLTVLKKAEDLYKKDKKFQQLLLQDSVAIGRSLSEMQLRFFLEEFVASYLSVYQKLNIANPYTEGREEWTLLAYPGKPFRSQIYFVQKNIMKFEKGDKFYIGHYDLLEKKYYDFLKINAESIAL